MKPPTCLLALPFLLAATAASAQQAAGTIVGADGAAIGSVTIVATPSGMLRLTAQAGSLPAGAHGFHIHETGRCDPADGFSSAGGHLAGGRGHGILAGDGPHPGDFPNVHVADDGRLMIEYFTDRLGFEGENALFDQDGSALVIHAGADDYASQPSGDAGDRIACAVLERSEGD